MAHSITLLTEEVRTLRDTNVALAKRRRAPKTRVQHRGALSIEDSKAIIASKTNEKCPVPAEGENSSPSKRAKTISRRCGVCSETGHNARTCSKDVESSSKSEFDET